MQSPDKSTGPKRTQKNTKDRKIPQMISNESSPLNETVRPNTSKKMKGGSLNENLEIDDTD